MAGGRYSFIDVAQGKPEQDREERLERIRSMRQQNEEREIGLTKRKKEIDAGLDDKEIEWKGLNADYKVAEQGFNNSMQKRQQGMVSDEVAGAEMDAKMSQFGRVYRAFELGRKDDAIQMFSDSQGLSRGMRAEDMSIEDHPTEKDAKGKPVKMFKITPEADAEGNRPAPLSWPVATVKRLQQQFGAKYQVVDGNLMRINPDQSVQRVFAAPHTSVNPETGQYYDQRQPPPASMGTSGQAGRRQRTEDRLDETHVDQRVKQAEADIRYGLTGSNTFANMDEATSAKFDRLMSIAGPKIRSGMNPEQAANEARAQFTRDEKLKRSPSQGERGTGLRPFPTPWRREAAGP